MATALNPHGKSISVKYAYFQPFSLRSVRTYPSRNGSWINNRNSVTLFVYRTCKNNTISYGGFCEAMSGDEDDKCECTQAAIYAGFLCPACMTMERL